jgi:hypothetical protein
MSFAFLLAGFLGTTNAGRVARAREASGPEPRSLVLALLAGCVLVVGAVILADDLLDALAISPESFRIAAGLVLAATAIWTIVWPNPFSGPFAAVLVTPELACLALSFGADEPAGRVLGAAAIALALTALAALARPRTESVRPEQFLAALQIIVAVALVVSGTRDV